MKNIIKYLVLIINLIILYCLLLNNNWILYNMTYIKAILFILAICLFIYICGIMVNDQKEYKRNILCYILLFFVLLFALTFIIGRPPLYFSKNHHLYAQLTPFYTIINELKYGTTSSALKNIVGNIIALIPLSFLLMLYSDKNNNILRQSSIIILTIIFIELFQDYSHTGSFDIDDIILNYLGILLFTFVMTKFKLIDKTRKWFYSDFQLNYKKKKVIFYVSLLFLVIVDILMFIK